MGIMNVIPGVLDPIPGGKHIVNMIDYVSNWARANSLWPLTYGTSCCAIEMMSSSMARYDIARFGSEVFRASPRQADLFIIAGTITKRMAPALQMLWEQIPGHKYAIAMGACTISGGPFIYDNYSVVRGADTIIPIDVFVPGWPPRPAALFHGLLTLRDKILKESFRNPWVEGQKSETSYPDRWSEANKAWLELEKIKDLEMAEARKRFKEQNPDYKHPKALRIKKPDFPEIPRATPNLLGLSHSEVFTKIKSISTHATLFKDSPFELDTWPADFPLDVSIPPSEYFKFIEALKKDESLNLDYLIDITAVDWESHYDVIVQLMNLEQGHKVFVRISLDKDANISEETKENTVLASLESISPLFPAAEWKEREVYDMFGIHFSGHPDLRRLFLDEDFHGFPLRKDFTHPHIMKRPV